MGEKELQRWSASRLKEELRRLQRQAEMRMGFAGGSETRATCSRSAFGSEAEELQHLLKSGLPIEKAELVQAVLKARGGGRTAQS